MIWLCVATDGEHSRDTPSIQLFPHHPTEGDMTMTEDQDRDSRVADFARRSLASLTPERRAECDLLASAELGMRLRRSEQYPDWCELLYGGAVVGLSSWAWLNDGDATRPSDGPVGYDGT
jgi:hypothetical protein